MHQATHVPATWDAQAIWALPLQAVGPVRSHRLHITAATRVLQAQATEPSTPTVAVTARTATTTIRRTPIIRGATTHAVHRHHAAAGAAAVEAECALPTAQAADSAAEATAVEVAEAVAADNRKLTTRRYGQTRLRV